MDGAEGSQVKTLDGIGKGVVSPRHWRKLAPHRSKTQMCSFMSTLMALVGPIAGGCRIRRQAATESWMRSMQCETQRRLRRSAGHSKDLFNEPETIFKPQPLKIGRVRFRRKSAEGHEAKRQLCEFAIP